jgi:hypothetical protein
MAIDPYSPCPGGLPKKVKFCCADLVSELDKIDRLREADQRAACLDHIEKLEAKHPGRACLMTAKADLLRDLGRTQEAEVAIKGLLDQSAANPIALAEAALVACEEEDALRAMSLLQRALRLRQDPMPEKLVEALRDTGGTLLASGEVVAGRQLLEIYSQLVPQDRQIQAVLSDLARSKDVPLLLKEHWVPDEAPQDAAWKAEYAAALEPLHFVAWTEAAERLTALADKQPKAPQVWRSLAILRSWLADHQGAAEAWRKLASLEIPVDDAVEAEAVAQLIDPEAPDFVDMVQVEYQVHDLERVVEVLAGSPRCAPLDTAQLPKVEGVPPPKAVLMLLDRPKQPADATLDFEATPRVAGRLLLFGRETDRDPRLELSAYRGTQLQQCQSLLGELTFGMLGPARETAVLERVAAPVVELELRWFLEKPPNADDLQALRIRHRDEYLGQSWPATRQELFGGKSPEQAAAQPAQRIRVAAALMRLEHQLEQAAAEFDFDALRRRLNLPVPAAIEWKDQHLAQLPVARLARVNLEPLEEPQVAMVATRAMMDSLVKAGRLALAELLRRTVDKRTIPQGLCHQYLAMCVEDSREKLKYLELASRELDEQKMSSVPVDIQRLHLHVYRQEQQQALELITHLIDEHLNDRQFGPMVIETLAAFGLVRPDGKILRPRVDKPSPLAAGAEQPGKIWTPDSDRAASKPALWVPGT